jgi:hypothetical protein
MSDTHMAETDRHPDATPEGLANGEAEQAASPFTEDRLLFFEGSPIRNELSEAQSDAAAARRLSARHWSRLLYNPNAPWRGNQPYPAPEYPGKASRKR